MTSKLPKLLVSGCLIALPLLACAPREQVDARPVPIANTPAIAFAQRISLDGGSASEVVTPRALNNDPAALLARAADEVRLPDGTVGVRVDKRYYHTIVVCRLADGSFSTECPPAGSDANAAGARP